MSKSPLCPVCSIPGQILAPHLPSPARSSSKIKCRGSGEVMNHNNPPMVLPNGQVYSKKFLNSQKRSRSSEETTLGSLQANKGIDILIAWRENERQKPSNLEPDSNRLQFGSISRTFKSPKAEQKFADIPESSNFFCCPTTNQTFQPDHDTKPVYII